MLCNESHKDLMQREGSSVCTTKNVSPAQLGVFMAHAIKETSPN